MLRKCGRGPEDTRGYEMTGVKRLGYCVDGVWKDSKTSRYVQITDSSTGEVIAETPMCTTEEVTEVVESAHAAFGPWASKPIAVRTQVLFRFRALMEEHMEEIALLASTELGKNLDEARGHRPRHGQLPRATRCVRGHRSLQLPGHDPLRLDASSVHRHRQHPRTQGVQPGAHDGRKVARHSV